jgi:hypothetical protein
MGRISKEVKTQLALGVYSQYILAVYSSHYRIDLTPEQCRVIIPRIKLFIPHFCRILKKSSLSGAVLPYEAAWVLMCSSQQLDLLLANLRAEPMVVPEGISTGMIHIRVNALELNRSNGHWDLKDKA